MTSRAGCQNRGVREYVTVRRRPEVRLFCASLGPAQGVPLLVVHGGPDWDHSYLRHPLDGLERPVYLPDLRGCGRSTRGLGPGGYSFASAAEDLLLLADGFGWDRFDLLGFSTGGQIAQRVLLSGPERLRRLGAPILFLHGRQDMVFPASFAERAAEVLPGARAVVLEEAGHMAHVDRPEAWLRELSAFLAGDCQSAVAGMTLPS